jgi:PAS domain S-box-containing protein
MNGYHGGRFHRQDVQRNAAFSRLQRKNKKLEERVKELEAENIVLKEEKEQREKRAVIELNGDGSIVRVNPLVEKLLGYEERELVGGFLNKMGATDRDTRFLGLVPTMGSRDHMYEGARRVVDFKLKNKKVKRLGVDIEIVYGEDRRYAGAVVHLSELGVYRRMFPGIKTGIYEGDAPENMDDKVYREGELQQLTFDLITGALEEAHLSLKGVKHMGPLVAENMANVAGGNYNRQLHLSDVPPEIRKLLEQKNFPAENMPKKKESTSGKQNNP